ncbi:MAG TPA: hypothetical protein VFX00_12720 [Pedococcus sp.]|jgi:hypothetical protein|nr:hypothetical protein [Pedococcus sp.]
MTSYRRTQLPTTAPRLVRTATPTPPHLRLLVTGTGDGVSRRRAPSR